MRFLFLSAFVHAVVLFTFSSAMAKPRPKPRKPPPIAVAPDGRPTQLIPPVGHKGTNEGAQGRKNATEDAARASEGASPDFRRR